MNVGWALTFTAELVAGQADTPREDYLEDVARVLASEVLRLRREALVEVPNAAGRLIGNAAVFDELQRLQGVEAAATAAPAPARDEAAS